MAGHFGPKPDPKAKVLKNNAFSPERNQDNYDTTPKPKNFGLRGMLGLGQTVDLSPDSSPKSEWNFNPNHLVAEQNILFDQKQKELQKEIIQLREELKKLAQATTQLEAQVDIAIAQPITDASDYQLNFLEHLKTFVANFRKNVNEAASWMEMYQSKKSHKRGAFWGNVKKHGEAYLFSSEHSSARSAT